jgi:hypothetical protein
MDKDEALQMCLEYIETDAHERKYVRHAIKKALAAPVQEPSISVQWLAEMIISDCGCRTNNERLLELITARIEQHIRANTPPARPAPVQGPVAWQERQARRMSQGVVTEWTNWYPCRHRTIDEAREEASDHIPYEWRPLYTTPPAQEIVCSTGLCHYKALPDPIHHTDLSEHPEYISGWNDYRAAMLEMMK